MRRKKVFVTGCFDMLHSGHIFFLEQAATFGDLYVGIGSDETVRKLKGRHPVFNQAERRYVLDALKCVQKCFVNSGSGIMDFCKEIRQLSPDIFVVSEGADVPAKAQLCRDLGINYLVLKRESRFGHLKLSPTDLKRVSKIPYRLDLAGGWLDQAFVSKHSPGPVLTICVEPTIHFSERSGMASSSRRRAIELWQTEIPLGDREKLAKLLFSFENPPGSQYFSGSQDAIGIVFPGLNRLDYNGQYWPEKITSVQREEILVWLEKHLRLRPLGPRPADFQINRKANITPSKVRRLAWAADLCWQSILERDLSNFAAGVKGSFEAQVAMFPEMCSDTMTKTLKQYGAQSLGWKLSGCGGGGYMVMVANRKIPKALKIKIRRNSL